MKFFDDNLNTIDSLLARRNELFAAINKEFSEKKAKIQQSESGVRNFEKIVGVSLPSPKVVKSPLIWAGKAANERNLVIRESGIFM